MGLTDKLIDAGLTQARWPLWQTTRADEVRTLTT